MDSNGGVGWGIWDLAGYHDTVSTTVMTSSVAGAGDDHQLHYQQQQQQQQQRRQLTSLNLGKRPYYEGNGIIGSSPVMMKRERLGTSASLSSSSMAVVPRCQVDGCGKPLIDAKEYHRRHKVCEMHSKAPKVVVLGAEQRFCQQCSRFHAVSEFDDAKRSCRRRLAGHNERRRKSSHESICKNSSLEGTMMGNRFPYISSATPGRALSLLSSKSSPWISTSDLSSRSSAALRELIAENRAALLARQLFSDRNGWQNTSTITSTTLSYLPQQHEQIHSQEPSQLTSTWDHFQETGTQVTLDLMQMPDQSFEFLSGRSRNKDQEEECCDIWKSLEGTHVV
ncbi:squamosa promoter-binding-like protein 7 [Dioscorea cayenensis subsp. rotundata]|uniref:Squamosa promoter-binding-like protein 7 n=1 Tax=Dioscorea cayennensis subsp. rotundata TaxID=55577 RepID=A0AB40CNP5_DIOCR|nr:squamosa promoter-binding-like protein 7 [Dioscorea cayenensis subsp. rotundata]